MAGISHVDLVLQDEPRMRGMAAHFPHRRFVYRAVDLYSHARGDVIMAEAERELLGVADRVVATSSKVAEHLHQLDPSENADVIPNGFDATLFASVAEPHETLSASKRPRGVYVGAIDNRFDFSAIRALASEMPELELLLYGPGSPPSEPAWPANVRWMGALAYQEIPAVLQHCDFALLPFRDTPVNHGRSPMKYHEYRAAGLPIVSFSIESLQQQSQDDELFLYPSTRFASISDAARAAMECTCASTAAKRSGIESEHSWYAIGNRLLELALTDA
jgi:teichuronic acid biosynthesis glycosyltransferase TuaH